MRIPTYTSPMHPAPPWPACSARKESPGPAEAPGLRVAAGREAFPVALLELGSTTLGPLPAPAAHDYRNTGDVAGISPAIIVTSCSSVAGFERHGAWPHLPSTAVNPL